MATLYITPDIGWVNVEDMLDPTKNDLVYSKDTSLMTVHTGEVTETTKARWNLSFDLGVGKRRVPDDDLFKFTGHGRRYVWREGTSGAPSYFTLLVHGGDVA